MYFQPYGDEQQLNLNWIINEIINLHKQLDPDYETPSFTQVYPYSNLNRLNLDWVLSELKALKELAPEPAPELDIQAVAEALVALPFDSNTSYQINDFISRDGEIWRATEAIAAGGVWDETKWFKTKIGTDIQILNQRVYNLNAGQIAYDNNATYNSNTIGYKINNLNNAGENTLDDCNNFILGIKKVGPTTLNMPENAYGFIESYIAQNNSWKWQLLITTQTPQKIFKRANINNTGWTEWVRIVDNTDIDNLNAGQVEYNSEGTYNNETVGKELQELMKWENGSVSLSSGGGTLISDNTRLLANRALKIALLEFQVNGSDGNTELTLSIPSTDVTKPIYAYNQLTNTAIKCTLESSILRIWESSTLTRASLFYYLP